MRVAIFHNLPQGGAINALYQLVRFMLGRYKDLTIDLYTIGEQANYLDKNQLLSKLCDSYKHVEIAKPKNIFSYLYFVIFTLKRVHEKLSKSINQENYDICLISHDIYTKSPYVLRYIKHRKVYILHEPQREYHEDLRLHINSLKELLSIIILYPVRWIDYQNAQFAEQILVNSRYSYTRIKEIYKKSSKILYPIPQDIVNKKITNRKANYILFVGSLHKLKGIQEVLRLFSTQSDMVHKVVIVTNSTVEKVNRLKRDFSGLNMRIYRQITDSKLFQLYANASLCIFNYHLEPFGMSCLEAQLHGSLVLARNEGGLQETLVDKRFGFHSVIQLPKLIKEITYSSSSSLQIHNKAIKKVNSMIKHNKAVLDNIFI